MNEVQPLAAQELEKREPVPSGVIAVVNQLLKKNWNGTCSIVSVKEAIGLINLLSNYPIEVIQRNKWMESLKPVYEKFGYVVEYLGEEDNRCVEFRLA